MCRDLSRVSPLLTLCYNISMISILFRNKLQVFLASKINSVSLAVFLS